MSTEFVLINYFSIFLSFIKKIDSKTDCKSIFICLCIESQTENQTNKQEKCMVNKIRRNESIRFEQGYKLIDQNILNQ